MTGLDNNENKVNKSENILVSLNNNKNIFKIITYLLIFLIVGGGLTAIVLSSLIPVNPDGADETALVKQFETPYIYFVSYLCMAILGILLILYIISVVYNITKHGDNK